MWERAHLLGTFSSKYWCTAGKSDLSLLKLRWNSDIVKGLTQSQKADSQPMDMRRARLFKCCAHIAKNAFGKKCCCVPSAFVVVRENNITFPVDNFFEQTVLERSHIFKKPFPRIFVFPIYPCNSRTKNLVHAEHAVMSFRPTPISKHSRIEFFNAHTGAHIYVMASLECLNTRKLCFIYIYIYRLYPCTLQRLPTFPVWLQALQRSFDWAIPCDSGTIFSFRNFVSPNSVIIFRIYYY